MGFEERKQIFRPLIPDVDFITFNNEADLAKITTRTAGIVLETIRWCLLFNHIMIFKSSCRCTEVGALMILDEIQPGFENGKTFDSRIMMLSLILLLGKGMGGGMPVGALPHQPK
jgi:acetylornithine/succinyldiaminopimelate/putrescine aminotransferase